MAKWIDLGDINKYAFFPFGGGILAIIFSIILGKMKSNLRRHPLLRGMNSGLGMAVAFVPYLIIKKRSQAANKNIRTDSEVFINMLEDERKKVKKNKYLLLLICSFFEFLQKYLTFSIIHNEQNNVWIFNLFFFTIFSRFILNQKFYRHQYLSITVIVILLLLSIFFYDLEAIKEKNGIYFFFSLFIELVYSVNYVLNKYLMEKKFCSPFEVCSFEGLFIIIFNLVLASILSFVEIPKNSGALKVFKHLEYDGKIYIEKIKDYVEAFDGTELLSYFVNIIYKVIFNLCCLLTINHFTPAHTIIILFFDNMQYFVETTMRGNTVLTIFIFIFLFFFILVFTEMIELNFCEISKNTKKNIRERALKEEKEGDEDVDSFKESRSGNRRVELIDGVLVDIASNPSINDNDSNI